ncbi:MAG: hypothetical protein EOP68_10750, partial [Sphingomonas sp.]
PSSARPGPQFRIARRIGVERPPSPCGNATAGEILQLLPSRRRDPSIPGTFAATCDRACDLGMAFQLANIARDLDEDDRAGRCYLPIEWLVEMDIPPGEAMRPHYRARIAVLARRLADRAADFEASARTGTRALTTRSAWAVLAAADIYGAIGRAVARRGERAWDRRVTTSGWQKLKYLARSGVAARRRRTLYADAPRDPELWTRPR